MSPSNPRELQSQQGAKLMGSLCKLKRLCRSLGRNQQLMSPLPTGRYKGQTRGDTGPDFRTAYFIVVTARNRVTLSTH